MGLPFERNAVEFLTWCHEQRLLEPALLRKRNGDSFVSVPVDGMDLANCSVSIALLTTLPLPQLWTVLQNALIRMSLLPANLHDAPFVLHLRLTAAPIISTTVEEAWRNGVHLSRDKGITRFHGVVHFISAVKRISAHLNMRVSPFCVLLHSEMAAPFLFMSPCIVP